MPDGRKAAPRWPFRLWRPFARGALICCTGLLASLGIGGTVGAEIVAARYADPTTRYGHAILGDAVEFGALELELRDGRTLRAVLPETLVFEDTAPRLADLDGDGDPEVIVVESALTLGARLAVWDDTGRLAATPHIGRSNRWLAPVGAADLDSDGRIEVAYVDRPHLAKVLRIWRLEAGRLVAVADLAGLTNHRIGWNYILGGIRECGARPEIILADAGWTQVIAVTLDGGALHARAIGTYEGRKSIDAALDCD